MDATVAVPARALGPAVVREATPLLDWQLWCLGRDICVACGNLLLAAGFERHRPDRLGTGTAAYVRELGPGRRLIVWGFGVCYGDDALGGVFLRRHGFLPRLTPATIPMPAWLPTHVRPARAPRNAEAWRQARTLTAAACEALAAHERFVLATVGADHRHRCAAERPRRMQRALRIAPHETAAAWDAVAGILRGAPEPLSLTLEHAA